ncbi:COA8 family protein Y39B6A.34, mitochondrial [Macrobrachium rosenbergii]|uniref:COA8 family protein Y39B6A.34, mitochondrial n=1 Tax=Macrobrachium rosenbergii TaxID=79674 RepID=UPI0034D65210
MLRMYSPNNVRISQLNFQRYFETSSSLSSQRLSKKKEKNRIIDPNEEKCNCVGPPDPLSNLRVIKYYVPSDETQLERKYRLAQQATHEFNQKFWADHNEKFKKMKAEFIKMKLKEKYGDCEKDKKMLSADEMSQFYKRFLDDHRLTHKQYNNEWYKRNIDNLVLAARVWLEQTLKTRRR